MSTPPPLSDTSGRPAETVRSVPAPDSDVHALELVEQQPVSAAERRIDLVARLILIGLAALWLI